jgi:hypothetical protein
MRTKPTPESDVLRLCVSSSEECLLIARIAGASWCGCTLVVGENRVFLGAESRSYIIDHLIEALGPRRNVTGRINDLEVSWVLSLAEEHSSLYIAGEADCRVLFLQDRNGQLIHTMRLSMSDVESWRAELDRYRRMFA